MPSYRIFFDIGDIVGIIDHRTTLEFLGCLCRPQNVVEWPETPPWLALPKQLNCDLATLGRDPAVLVAILHFRTGTVLCRDPYRTGSDYRTRTAVLRRLVIHLVIADCRDDDARYTAALAGCGHVQYCTVLPYRDSMDLKCRTSKLRGAEAYSSRSSYGSRAPPP